MEDNNSPKTAMDYIEERINNAFIFFCVSFISVFLFPLFLRSNKDSFGVWYYLLPGISGIIAIVSLYVFIKVKKNKNKIIDKLASFPSKTNISRKTASNETNSPPYKIFFSYSTEDSKEYDIPKIAENLEKFSEIDKVYYWERDTKSDIVQYMNDNLENADVFILFCSIRALNSKPVQNEYGAALSINKVIIPIFVDDNDIPTILKAKKGVKFNIFERDKFPKNLYDEILKKF